MYRQLEQVVGGKDLIAKIEGYSNQVVDETQVMNQVVSDKRIKTVCETGFNAGHGTLRWLLHSSSQAHVYSFDLGSHQYAQKGAAWIAQNFPGRHTITWGDSTKTLPAFHQQHPEVKCDLIFVDGGHTHAIALADLQNFMLMANPDFNIIIMDDVHCKGNWCHEPLLAWQEMINQKFVKETEAHPNGERGFARGFYMKPNKLAMAAVASAAAPSAKSAAASASTGGTVFVTPKGHILDSNNDAGENKHQDNRMRSQTKPAMLLRSHPA